MKAVAKEDTKESRKREERAVKERQASEKNTLLRQNSQHKRCLQLN